MREIYKKETKDSTGMLGVILPAILVPKKGNSEKEGRNRMELTTMVVSPSDVGCLPAPVQRPVAGKQIRETAT
jgi:hypothetical protein